MTRDDSLALLGQRLEAIQAELTEVGKNQAAVLEHKKATDARLDGLHEAIAANRNSLAEALTAQSTMSVKLDNLTVAVAGIRPLWQRTGFRVGSYLTAGAFLLALLKVGFAATTERTTALGDIRGLQVWSAEIETDRAGTLGLTSNICRWTEALVQKEGLVDGDGRTSDSLAALSRKAAFRAATQIHEIEAAKR